MSILIKNALIVDGESKETIKSSIYINKNIIQKIGNEIENVEAQTVIDAKNKLVMPGLINAHTHSSMTLLRSYADDLALQNWLFNYIFPVEAKLTAEDIYWGSMLGIAEMIASGTTCFADMYYFMDKVAEAVNQTGIRAHLSRGLLCDDEDVISKDDDRVIENIRLFKEWNLKANGRIKVGFGPHAIYTCSSNYLEGIREIAIENGADIHIHVDETSTEHFDCIEKNKKTPVAYLNSLGIFDVNVIAAHCVHLTDEDLDILKEKSVSLVHNPSSNLKLGSGIAPVPKALEKGINIALGTDGCSSNNNLNMFEEINLASFIHKGINQDPLLVKAFEAIKMGTVNGAKALGFDKLGLIKEGYKADIIILDIDKPHFYPVNNMISNLAYSAQGNDVDTVIVDGRILYQNKEYKTIDFEKIKYNVNRIAKRILN